MGPSTSRRGDARWLLVRAGAATYAMPIAAITRILRSVQVFPLPGARSELLGLIQHAGEPVAVLDLASVAQSGSESGGTPSLVVVAKVGSLDHQEIVGLAADEALTVVTIADRLINQHIDGLVQGEAMVDGEIIRCLDLTQLGSQGLE